MLANLINQHALADAQAGKWDAVAATLNALTQTVTVGRVGGKASLSALVAAGIDPSAVITAMRSDPMASELLNTLTASGVDWADDLTAFVMGKLVASGKITQQTADVMRSLSVRDEPLISTTAGDCQKAWTISETRRRVNQLAAKATAVNAWCDALDLTTKSPDEVQEYCESLLASNDGNPA
jgi:hypothetical protein